MAAAMVTGTAGGIIPTSAPMFLLWLVPAVNQVQIQTMAM